MSDRDLDGVLDAWLDEGPTVVSDRVVDGALAEIPTTRQVGVIRAPLEGAIMRLQPYTRALGLTAAAAVAILAVYLALAGTTNVGGPETTPSPTAEPSATSSTFRSDGFRVPISARVPDGWVAGIDDERAIGILHVDTDAKIVVMPRAEAGFLEAAGFQTWPEDLHAYLSDRPEFEPEEARTDSIAGHEAVLVEAMGDSGTDELLPITAIEEGPFTSEMHAGREHWSFWEIDVDGDEDLIIVMVVPADAPPGVLPGAEEIIDSIELTGSSGG